METPVAHGVPVIATSNVCRLSPEGDVTMSRAFDPMGAFLTLIVNTAGPVRIPGVGTTEGDGGGAGEGAGDATGEGEGEGEGAGGVGVGEALGAGEGMGVGTGGRVGVGVA